MERTWIFRSGTLMSKPQGSGGEIGKKKTFGNVQGTILKNTGGEKRQFVEHGEGENLLFEDQDSNIEAEQSNAENLHTYLEPEDSKSPVLTPMDLNPCAYEILEDATSILTSISPGKRREVLFGSRNKRK